MSRPAAVLKNALPAVALVGCTTATARTAAGVRPNAYAGLIARLFLGDDPLRIVAFASALPREGVTFTVARVAAEVERMTGLRSTVVSASELLAGTSAAPIPILGASALNGSNNGRDKLANLQSEFDVILVDAGSVAKNGAVFGLAYMVEAVVMVVEAGRTRREELNRALSTIAVAHGKIAGLVLNKHKNVLPAWLERLLG